MWRLLPLLLLALACTPPGDVVPDLPERPEPDDSDPVDTSAPYEPDTETTGESDVVMDGSLIFDHEGVHTIAITLGDESMAALRADGRSWAEGSFSLGGRSYPVGARLKGNTVYQEIDAKPAFKIDFNRVDPEGHLYGLPSLYLHNMILDPSRMHERLAYRSFRLSGAAAARTAYAQVSVNELDYGIYLIVEKQNSTFLEQWVEDTSGSIYEAGSFNHPCDLWQGGDDDPCRCYEIDKEGEGDSFEDLQRFCLAARAEDEVWLASLEPFVDMDRFLAAQAMEIVVSHYDNYGWNINNYRIYHDPSTDMWTWTPWSTDLSFGWYPWMDGAHCGSYGVAPTEYQTGYLMQRCFGIEACRERLYDQLLAMADAFEAQDVGGELERTNALIADLVFADERAFYDGPRFEQELDCMREWITARPEAIRFMVESAQAR